MRRHPSTLSFFLAALLGSGPLAPQAALSASAPEEEPVFHLMAHSFEVEGEVTSYFTYRPHTPEADRDEPLLLLVAGDEEGVLAWVQRKGLLETAKAQGRTLLLLDASLLRDRQALDRVLNEFLDLV